MRKMLLVVFLSIILCFTACNSETVNDISKTEKVEKETTTLSTKDTFVNYILDELEVSENNYTVIPVSNGAENQDFLVVTTAVGAPMNWYVKFDGEKVIEKKDIVDKIPSIKLVELVQGTYVEVAQKNADGTGNIILWDQDNEKIAYEFSEVTLDMNFEGCVDKEIAEKYDLQKIGNEMGEGYSFIYLSSCTCMESHYSDLNADGYDDVTFYATKSLVTGDANNYESVKDFIVKEKYLYNPELDEFVYSEELSKEREYK